MIYDSLSNLQTSSIIGNIFMFTAREYNSETSDYFYRARYYDDKNGRFNQSDPLGFVNGFSLYAYVNNNPVNNIDPFGTIIFDAQSNCKAFCAAGWAIPTALCAAAASPSVGGSVCCVAVGAASASYCGDLCEDKYPRNPPNPQPSPNPNNRPRKPHPPDDPFDPAPYDDSYDDCQSPDPDIPCDYN